MSVALLTAGCTPLPLKGSALTVNDADYRLPVRSMLERRYLTVVRQQYDFSCGSAALATLLHFHYNDQQNEQSVFIGMWRDGDRQQIRRLGFSLLDMKRYLAARGMAADGYRVTLEQVKDAGIPGIALINMNGYRHFVVVKGVEDGQVLLGDPSLGLRLVSVRRFQAMWNGIMFVINDRVDQGKKNFSRDDEWALVARARVNLMMEPTSLQALALVRPGVFPTQF